MQEEAAKFEEFKASTLAAHDVERLQDLPQAARDEVRKRYIPVQSAFRKICQDRRQAQKEAAAGVKPGTFHGVETIRSRWTRYEDEASDDADDDDDDHEEAEDEEVEEEDEDNSAVGSHDEDLREEEQDLELLGDLGMVDTDLVAQVSHRPYTLHCSTDMHRNSIRGRLRTMLPRPSHYPTLY